ncbi:hypothetical protein [Streptomyces sp. NPDC059979]|uniref:hypothetical protein n=1 Tax=Streptomyces sp. NPDC059979 TaxID=3347021 RepID=UPI0036ACD9EC
MAHYDLYVQLAEPRERLPLLTRGEAGGLIDPLGRVAEAQFELRTAALELQATIGMPLPAE